MYSLRFVSLFLIAMTASAQNTGFRGGSMAGFRSGAGRFGPPVFSGPLAGRDARSFGRAFSFNQRFGNFAAPYVPYLGGYPFIGDYGLDYLPPTEYPPINDTFIVQPAAPASPPAPPPQPAHAVINEYKWNDPAAALGEQVMTFTIALKDGSKRYPVAVWVENGNLHCVDSRGRQQVLSSDVIDHNTTERLNHPKNFELQLPPG